MKKGVLHGVIFLSFLLLLCCQPALGANDARAQAKPAAQAAQSDNPADPSTASLPGGPRSRYAIRKAHPEIMQELIGKLPQKDQKSAKKEQEQPPTPSTSQVQSIPAGDILKFSELPPNIRNSIPELTISMLLYSRSPGERAINVDGVRLQEGQEVSAGLKVEEITPEGAVFSFQGSRFIRTLRED